MKSLPGNGWLNYLSKFDSLRTRFNFDLLKSKEIISLVLVVILASWARFNLIPFTGDDAYITFRFSRNIVNGLGFVYNQGEHVLGTTTPLLTLALAAVNLVGVPIILASKIIGIVFGLSYITTLTYYLNRHKTNILLLILFGIFISISPTNAKWDVAGMETALYTFLVYLLLFNADSKSVKVIGLIAALCFLTRIDATIALAALVIHKLIEKVSIKQIVYIILVFIAFILPWLIFSTIYFGSPIPNSAIAKSVTYAHYPVWAFLEMMFKQMTFRLNLFLSLPIILIITISILYVLTKKKQRIFAIWTVLYITFFSFTGAPMHAWYFAPLLPAIFFQMFLLFSDMFNFIKEKFSPLLLKGIYAFLVMMIVIALISGVYLIHLRTIELKQNWQAFEEKIVNPISDYISTNGKEGDVLSLETFGAMGWVTDYPILDRGGLVSPEVIPLNKKVNGVASIDIILHFEPRFVVTWATWEEEKMFVDLDKKNRFFSKYKLVGAYNIEIKKWNFWERIEN